jgi:hypothetical protein
MGHPRYREGQKNLKPGAPGFPDVAVELFVNAIARPLVEEKKIKQVDVSSALPQPA